jgi:diguanylate cyclase (GGDEF)-like protein
MKLLIIDDDDEIRELVRFSAARQRVHMLDAGSGADGVRKAEAEQPDAILLDVMMPVMDGPATLQALRANPRTAHIPVIFLTASSFPADKEHLQSLGARAVFSKPFEPNTLADNVRRVLASAGGGGSTRPATPSTPENPAVTLEELKAEFVRSSNAKLEEASRLLLHLTQQPEDREALHGLMRLFHSFAGLGSSYGFVQVSALGKEGELASLALLRSDSVPGSTERDSWARLVAAIGQELSRVHSPEVEQAPLPEARPYRVLIVDEDEGVRETLTRLVEQEGMTAEAVCTRADALAALVRGLPDGIVTDVRLADGSGYELVNQVRSMPGGDTVAILMLSLVSEFLDKVEAIHCGADGSFEKPVDWKALMRRLQHLLDNNRPQPFRILSVEDDPQQAAYIRAILKSAGHDVVTCTDPKQFETVLLRTQPDLVLMDIVLGTGISGYDLVRYVRQDEKYATLPILFLTTEGQSRSQSARVGGDDHLVKPINPGLLLSAVAGRVERARFLRNLLERDGLTRLLTHTAFVGRAAAAHAAKQRDPRRSSAWVMIDIDHFKSVNDRFGHPVGDRVLAVLSALLRRRLRQSDTIGRYGGEEFAVLFEGLPEDEVIRLIDRVLDEFRGAALEAPGGQKFHVTFSAGVALLDTVMDLDEWKKAADDALYAAKHAGRNRVVAATRPGTLPAQSEIGRTR